LIKNQLVYKTWKKLYISIPIYLNGTCLAGTYSPNDYIILPFSLIGTTEVFQPNV